MWICCICSYYAFVLSRKDKPNPEMPEIHRSLFSHLYDIKEKIDKIQYDLNVSFLLKKDTNLENNLQIKRDIHFRQMHKQKENIKNALFESGREYFQSHWEPSWNCEFEERFGNFGDGGKWVCDAHTLKQKKEDCHIVSIGSNNDFSFENELHNHLPQCKISVFDHTVSNPSPPPFVNFFSFGLGSENNDNSIITLDSAFQKAGVSSSSGVDILKIDCEGCEYDVYSQFVSSKYLISQILIEIHFRNSASVHKMFQTLTNNNYVVFHKEPNIMYSGGDCVEYGFLKLKLDDN
jgi:hypothetical protein